MKYLPTDLCCQVTEIPNDTIIEPSFVPNIKYWTPIPEQSDEQRIHEELLNDTDSEYHEVWLACADFKASQDGSGITRRRAEEIATNFMIGVIKEIKELI